MADEPMARGTISLARLFHWGPIFLSLLLEERLYILKNMRVYVYIYIYTYLTAYRLYVNHRCYQMILRVKYF